MAQKPEMLPPEIFAKTTQLLVELCTISSSSGDSQGLSAMAARVAAELALRGLAPEIIPEDDGDGGSMPLLVARGPRIGDHPLVLVGHMDTVLDAVAPRLEGHRLWATGALDMKGGLAMLIGALDLMAARGKRPPDDLMLVLVPDEEEQTGQLIRQVCDGDRAGGHSHILTSRCDAGVAGTSAAGLGRAASAEPASALPRATTDTLPPRAITATVPS